MLSINTNLGSLIVQSNLSKSSLGLQQAIERIDHLVYAHSVAAEKG